MGDRRKVGGPSGPFLWAKGQICAVPAVGGSPQTCSALLRLREFPLAQPVQQIVWSPAGSCQYWPSLRQPEAEQRRVHQWELKWQVLCSGGVWAFGAELHLPLLCAVKLSVSWACAQNSFTVPFYRKINFVFWEGSALSLLWPDKSRCSLKAELVTLLLEWF